MASSVCTAGKCLKHRANAARGGLGVGELILAQGKREDALNGLL